MPMYLWMTILAAAGIGVIAWTYRTVMGSPPLLMTWNPHNRVVQDKSGTIDHAATNRERARRGLPVPWTTAMGDREREGQPVP